MLYPPWWKDRPRETWCELRYWITGRGNRMTGRLSACPAGMVAWAKERLRTVCGAVRFEIANEVHQPAAEVTRMPVSNDITWILGTLPRRHIGPLFPSTIEASNTELVPDG